MKKTKVWLRWIALTLLVILCINSVGSIALASEIQEEGYDSEAELLEEKSNGEFQVDLYPSSQLGTKKQNFRMKKVLQKKNRKKREAFRKKVILQKTKHLLSNRKQKKRLRILRKSQKDMILIFMSSSMEKK